MRTAVTNVIVRSIRAVRAKYPRALALGVLTLSVAFLGSPGGFSSAQAARGPSVGAALGSLQRAGAITVVSYQQYYSAYVAAQRSLRKLSGTRRTELGGVLANVQAIAAAHGFIASRLPALFMTLERNRTWWTTGPLLAGRARVSFPSSKLVWEYYPGQGIEIQWLGTFGEGNGYFLSGHENANLRQLVSEIIPLATKRGDGIAWEYMFQFDGGLPPWTSGLSQGTALQVLARAWSRMKEPADLTAAQEALGIFQSAPPNGVRVMSAIGAHYLEYTYARSDRILNGEIQALVGLYDYTSITKDPLGLKLFEAGDAEARARVPTYDTGGWSMYDQFGESDLSYHELLTEFLKHLCERTGKGEPLSPAAAPAPAPTPAPAPAPAAPATGGTAGEGAPPSAARYTARSISANAVSPAISADAIYCTTAQRFTADLHTPPAIALLTSTLRGGARGGVQISLSKVSNVGLTIRRSGNVVWTNRATLEHGKPRLLWLTPKNKPGAYSVTLTATDLAGNSASATGTVTVTSR
jgi:hypothetical protein